MGLPHGAAHLRGDPTLPRPAPPFLRPVLGQEGWEGRGGGGGVMTSPRNQATSPRNRVTSPRNRAGGTTKPSPRNRGSRQQMAPHSRTMDPKKVAASQSFCGSSVEGRDRDREGRRRQEDFLQRHAWTEEEE